jgi:glycerol-3-phosphate dehydrogenase (NAD(P)+)
MSQTVAVLGAGSWGTALAVHLARNGHIVRLWTRSPDLALRLAEERQHTGVHPGIMFPDLVTPTHDLAGACDAVDAVVFVCASHGVRTLGSQVATILRGEPVIVSAAKGIEEATQHTMSDVLEEVLGPGHARQVSSLSGPSFAREVATGMPTAVTAAAHELSVAERVQTLFHAPAFRVYTTTDLVGVEIGGAVKNVIAVAAGVSDGLGFGHSTRAALITRGLAEISRLAVTMGADRQTLYGLSGLGDLALTCTGDLSRNRNVGLRLGRGEPLRAIQASMKEVAEGIRNTQSVHDLAIARQVEMPIAEQMYEVLYQQKEPRRAVIELMGRRSRQEAD